MAFFEEFGKKISQAGQSAIQKTKDMTDVARINAAISEEEKTIDSNYRQIGKLYVAMHAADCEKDFEGMVSIIKEAEIRIRDYRQQIQDIKGMVRCEKCGAAVPSDVAFCSSCGAQMPRPNMLDENSVRCSACGAVVPKGMRFCNSCGKPMVDITQSYAAEQVAQAEQFTQEAPAYEQPEPVEVETPEVPVEVETPEVPVEDAQVNTCPNCGKTVEDGFAFCIECGTRLG